MPYKDKNKEKEYSQRPEVKARRRKNRQKLERKAQEKEYREEHKKELRQYQKEYNSKPENKLKRKVYAKEYNSRFDIKARIKLYRQQSEVKAYYKKYIRIYDQKNKEIKKEKRRKHNQIPKVKEQMRIWQKYRRKNDLNFNLICNLRSALYHTLKIYSKTGKIYSSSKYGIDYKAIIEHLKPFPKDIKNYHVDHIKPLCSFNFVNEDGSTNLEEVKKAWLPSNLQWLTAEENMKKGSKIL